MSEIKLYFPGLGGNRYEVSMEELKDLAYKGKIKREDKLIVRETKDGNTTEVVILCNKIKGLEERFACGERDRQIEYERKEAAKEAAEKLKLAEIQKENERREAERLSEEKRRQEEEQRRQEALKRHEQQTFEWEEPELSSTEMNIVKSVDAIHGVANIVMALGVVLGIVEFIGGCILGAESQEDGVIVVAFIVSVGNMVLFWVVHKILLVLMLTPVRLAQYQTETIVQAISKAAVMIKESIPSSSAVATSNPDKRDSNA